MRIREHEHGSPMPALCNKREGGSYGDFETPSSCTQPLPFGIHLHKKSYCSRLPRRNLI